MAPFSVYHKHCIQHCTCLQEGACNVLIPNRLWIQLKRLILWMCQSPCIQIYWWRQCWSQKRSTAPSCSGQKSLFIATHVKRHIPLSSVFILPMDKLGSIMYSLKTDSLLFLQGFQKSRPTDKLHGYHQPGWCHRQLTPSSNGRLTLKAWRMTWMLKSQSTLQALITCLSA